MLSLSKPLVTDADDVLLDWLMGGFRPYVAAVTKKPICALGPKGWDMSSWVGLPYEETMALVRAFNKSEGFGAIPAFSCASQILPEIAKTGRHIHVVTSCARDAATHRRRRANLEALFGPIFTSITCLDIGESKAPILEAIADQEGTAGIWAEDNHKNGLAGADLGYTTFMFRRSHNRDHEPTCDHPRITWVDSWHDVAPAVLKKAA
jgi:hypothetical protein